MSNKFTQKAQNTLNHALNIARELGHTYVGSEHILLGILTEGDSIASRLLTTRGADIKRLRGTVIDISGIGSRSHVTPSDMTPRAKKIIEASAAESQRCGNNYIGTEHILYALMSERDSVAVRLLEAEGIPASEIIGDLNAFITASQGKQERSSPKGDAKAGDDKLKIKGAPMLSAHGRDLSAAAKEGRLDPLIGRDKETERLIQILSRRTKNNPCLIGEPGVGKTAVVEGLAERIVTKRVPESLADKRIVTLNIPSMIAGAKYRGEFEDRMKTVMEEVEKNPDIILFIDEIHIIIGAGAAEGAVDAANIIKPALARGQLQVIGATTISEYRTRIEKDPALERRFQSVYVSEPSKEEALDILMGIREKYEEHHKLKISDEAIRAAVDFSVRYIPDRFLPDKAIDLIDEAASRIRIEGCAPPPELSVLEGQLAELSEQKERAVECQNFELAASVRDRELALRRKLSEEKRHSEGAEEKGLCVGASDVAKIVTQWTGIPVSNILEDENRRLLSLEEKLSGRVIGQGEAISAVSRAIRRGRIGLKDPHRPIGSFIFIGKTGVGKTELSAAIAIEIFGSEKSLIKLDMSEYMEKHSVSRLIGSPPGYVGYEDGGQLTEKIRRRPYSVVLFDEIEKAHPDVFNLLLQILEDGRLTDSQGRCADFSNSIIIMTSNAGASDKRAIVGFSDTGHSSDTEIARQKKEMLSALKTKFRPEFLNRIDDIIVFRSLDKNDIERIASGMLDELSKRAKALEISLSFDENVAKYLSDKSHSDSFGARQLRRDMTKLIEDPLSEEFLKGGVRKGENILATVKDERVVFNEI